MPLMQDHTPDLHRPDLQAGLYAWWGGAVHIHVGRGLGNLLEGPMVNKTLDVVKAIFTIVYAASADIFPFLQIHEWGWLSDLGDEGLCPWNEAITAHKEFSGAAEDAASGERPHVGGHETPFLKLANDLSTILTEDVRS